MPDLDLTWLRSSLANWHVYSVMLFPHDEERRQLLVEVLNAANLNEHFARSDVLVGGRIAGWMYEAPRFEDVINKEQWRYMDASISFVARALHHVLSAAANGHPEIASLAAAYKIEMAERAKAKTGGRKLDTLKNSWREYSCVAHLWLAFFKAPFDPFGRVGEGHPAVLGLWLHVRKICAGGAKPGSIDSAPNHFSIRRKHGRCQRASNCPACACASTPPNCKSSNRN